MADIPDNPTWAQLQAGLTGAGRAKKFARNQENTSRAIIDAETNNLKIAKQNVARADAELGQWLQAVRRKIDTVT
jgi:hypothetical protein